MSLSCMACIWFLRQIVLISSLGIVVDHLTLGSDNADAGLARMKLLRLLALQA